MIDSKGFWSEHDAALSTHLLRSQGELSHDLYRGMPPWFNAYFSHFQRRAVVNLLSRCTPLEGMRALDAGCGTGRWSELLVNMGARPVGVDIGLHALWLAARCRPGASFCAAALPYLGFGDGAFDLAITFTVLQHVPTEQQPEAIAALARVLRLRGWLVACELVDPSDSAPHVFAHSASTWQSMFQAAGLRLLAYVPCEYLPYVKWFQLMRGWLGRLGLSESASLDVTTVATSLQKRPALAWVVRSIVAVSYPLEYLASWLLPKSRARVGGFLLQKG